METAKMPLFEQIIFWWSRKGAIVLAKRAVAQSKDVIVLSKDAVVV